MFVADEEGQGLITAQSLVEIGCCHSRHTQREFSVGLYESRDSECQMVTDADSSSTNWP